MCCDNGAEKSSQPNPDEAKPRVFENVTVLRQSTLSAQESVQMMLRVAIGSLRWCREGRERHAEEFGNSDDSAANRCQLDASNGVHSAWWVCPPAATELYLPWHPSQARSLNFAPSFDNRFCNEKFPLDVGSRSWSKCSQHAGIEFWPCFSRSARFTSTVRSPRDIPNLLDEILPDPRFPIPARFLGASDKVWQTEMIARGKIRVAPARPERNIVAHGDESEV